MYEQDRSTLIRSWIVLKKQSEKITHKHYKHYENI